jgi:tetratricopeptide (TPR) repeat protein
LRLFGYVGIGARRTPRSGYSRCGIAGNTIEGSKRVQPEWENRNWRQGLTPLGLRIEKASFPFAQRSAKENFESGWDFSFEVTKRGARVTESLANHEYAQALASSGTGLASAGEKIEMLVEIALRLQHKPKSATDLQHAADLYEQALALSRDDELLAARIRVRKASALAAIVEPEPHRLLQARRELENALPHLEKGTPEELAEAEMNLGVVVQSLAGLGSGNIADAIKAYQRALRTFSRESYPTEYAILHNNLATAYLSIPFSDARANMREALAVQSFTEALKVVTLIDHPSEFAMLQNNLGNALQYTRSGHPIANNLRALEAYDAALCVRNAKDTPAEYANTIANKANCLRNLPDDPEKPGHGNPTRLRQSSDLYREALRLFELGGDVAKAAIVRDALSDVLRELEDRPDSPSSLDFGASRIVEGP